MTETVPPNVLALMNILDVSPFAQLIMLLLPSDPECEIIPFPQIKS